MTAFRDCPAIPRPGQVDREGGLGSTYQVAAVPNGHEDADRCRDLLPLPLPCGHHRSSASLGDVSRAVRRKVERREAPERMLCETIEALNSMHSGGAAGLDRCAFPPTAAQREALQNIRAAIARMGPPPEDLDAKAALAELRAAGPYEMCSVDTAGIRSSMALDKLSIPQVGASPPSVAGLLGVDEDVFCQEFLKDHLLPKVEVEIKRKAVGFKKPYSDPKLSSPAIYSRLIRKLADAGVVDFVADPDRVIEKVGMFTVSKKDPQKQRLVVDARGSNLHFGPPCSIHLATAESFSRLEIPAAVRCGSRALTSRTPSTTWASLMSSGPTSP